MGKTKTMKTLIAYSTTHGCTGKVALELKEKLGGEATLINLKEDRNPSLALYDQVIIGGSIHAGQIQKRVKEFCAKNLEQLKQKELGLFICCMYEGDVAREQLRNAFPEELHQAAKNEAFFGGAFDFKRMKFFEKMIVRKVAKVNESVSNLDYGKIDNFASRMNKIFNPFLFLV